MSELGDGKLRSTGGAAKSRGRQQELTYLGLMLIVLALAVVVFVAVRSIPTGEEESPPPSETVTEGAPLEPAQQRPRAETGRDPFRAPGPARSAGPGATAPPLMPSDLHFYGCVRRGSDLLAVIHDGEERHYTRLGDQVGGYSVTHIGLQEVVLARGNDRLVLRQAEPQ